jgi:hypothetical protein
MQPDVITSMFTAILPPFWCGTWQYDYEEKQLILEKDLDLPFSSRLGP